LGAFPAGTLTIDEDQTRGWYPPPEYYAPPDATPVPPAWGSPERRLVITGGALVWATRLDFGEIDVLDGSTLTTPPGQVRLSITTPVLDVDGTSQVTVNTRGYAGDGTGDDRGGTAPGIRGSGVQSGGSHGGKGGNDDVANNNSTLSGPTYDSATDPDLPGGGGGGSGDISGYDGNPGGGVLDLQVGSLKLDGVVSSNGSDSEGPTTVQQAVYDNDNGAGAGGSVLVHATELGGAGVISANGGFSCMTGRAPLTPKAVVPQPCNYPGGGPGAGGGGRVAVYVAAECGWTGDITASGGVDQQSVADGNDKTAMGQPGSVHVATGKGTCS
jgi:hypothetical protein